MPGDAVVSRELKSLQEEFPVSEREPLSTPAMPERAPASVLRNYTLMSLRSAIPLPWYTPIPFIGEKMACRGVGTRF